MMFDRKQTFRGTALRLAATACLAVVLLGMASCPQSLNYTCEPKWSVNLITPGRTWPRLDNMTPSALEAYDKFGRPDYFRVWYNRRGELANTRQAGPLIRQKQLGKLPRSWVYANKEIEIRFPSPVEYVEVPLSDKLKVLCERGDPQAPPGIDKEKSGAIREDWIYYDAGRKYIFLDDKLVDVQIFQGIGPAMKGRL